MPVEDKKENLLPKEPLDLPKESSTSQPQTTHEVKTLLSWTAPGRPFRKRGRQYYLTSLLIMFLIEIILFLFSQYLLMLVVVSLVFVAFALATVPPRNFHYRVSTEGITIEDHFFLWQELYDFYFRKIENIDTLHIRTHAFIPGELTIPLGDIDKEHLKSVLLPYLPFREVVRQTFMEKSGEWLSKNFPLENPNQVAS
ncbi:MAG: hypothetical protein HYT08_03310 [Candidatus Levybacteria bacterium]|nr:hypothetical protein [Candidatus Levybacteria bacterium]